MVSEESEVLREIHATLRSIKAIILLWTVIGFVAGGLAVLLVILAAGETTQ